MNIEEMPQWKFKKIMTICYAYKVSMKLLCEHYRDTIDRQNNNIN